MLPVFALEPWLYTASNARVEVFCLKLMENWDQLKICLQWCAALSGASTQCAVRKLFLRLEHWLWDRDTHGKNVQPAKLGMILVLVELGWADYAIRLNSLSLDRWYTLTDKITEEQELNQLISVKACFWHVCLYCVTQHCYSKIQIVFYSVFPAGNLRC